MTSRLFFLVLALSTLTVARAEISIPALTAYSMPDPDALHFNVPDGSVKWKNAAQQLTWFGEIRQPGKLAASVMVRLPKGHTSRLKFTVDQQSREAIATGLDTESAVDFGAFDIPQAGYVRFALELLDAKEASTISVTALVIDGSATDGAHFNIEPRRNAASVHLNYSLPKGMDIDAFYCEVEAIEDPVHTFYMACGFQRGYFGMQVNSASERRIIFSVWDSGAGKTAMKRDGVEEKDRTRLLAKGEEVTANVFGGEGTGGHSHLRYGWKTGEPQRFVLTAKPGENGSAIYSGYWFHPEKKSWSLLARFNAPNASASLGHFHSFSENFVGSNGHLRRKAIYANQWIHARGGEWVEVTEAGFSHDATGKNARLDRCMGVESGGFFLAHGGFVKGFTKGGDRFNRPATGKTPNDIDFSQLDLHP